MSVRYPAWACFDFGKIFGFWLWFWIADMGVSRQRTGS